MTNTMTRSFEFVGQLIGRSTRSAFGLRACLPLAVAALVLLPGVSLFAQAPAAGATKPAPTEAKKAKSGEVTFGKYSVHQSIELGGRIVNVSGNEQTYDTFSNIRGGARILGQSLQLRSTDPKKTPLFDSLSTASYGLGGDPNDITFLRFSKGKTYEFSGNFRRDRNYFNYNTLANPLIPQYVGSGATPVTVYVPFMNSPHAFNTTRRMTDVDVTILPIAKISYRIGVSHSTNEGPSFTTEHSSFVDMLLNQWWRNSTNTYRAGIDVKVAPKTVVSYDQTYLTYKGDTSLSLAGLNNTLPGAVPTPLSLGIEFFPALATAAAPTSTGYAAVVAPATTATLTTPSCGTTTPYVGAVAIPLTCTSLAYSDTRTSPTRNTFPTEQIRLASSVIPNVTLNARAFYRGSTVGAVNNYDELGNGFKASGTAGASTYLPTGTAYSTRELLYTGALNSSGRLATMKRIDTGADAGATWQVMPRLTLTDNFVFADWRETGAAKLLTNTAYGPNDGTLTSMNYTPVGFGALGSSAVFHNAGTGADSSSSAYVTGFAQKSRQNTFLVSYEITPKAKLTVGYKYRNRIITGSGDYNEATNYYATGNPKFSSATSVSTYVLPYDNSVPKGSTCIQNSGSTACTVTVLGTYAVETHNFTEDWGLIGINLQPTSKLHVNINYDFMSADGILTPTNDRKVQEFKFRGSYKPTNWLSFAFSGHDHEGRNAVRYVNHRDHSSDYSFGADIVANDKLSFDLNYAYDDVFASTGFCYMSTGLLGAPAGPNCYGGSASVIYSAGTGYYDTPTQFGAVSIHYVPTKKLITNFGYRITEVDGVAERLNKRQALNSLSSRYQAPFADITLAIAPQWFYKAAWNYTGYSELSPAGPLGSHTFHGNELTLGVKYAF